ncbi:type I-E CRISPR-associated protein Cse1/CasA [Actinoallomurus liliacearum]|uniref:Type I-E CRISPR-associated protein Cse1/CasA n=1 Tax=Actinoallomurus liliacearum TaxID=1080073 RepID=A0ABP8TGR8_9ACTN
MTFDLITQPWLPIVGTSGELYEVGLADLVRRAHESRRIAGESPTMTAALHRLVLAFTHRVYGPSDEDAWNRLWMADGFDTAPIEEYVRQWPGRFDLFHPSRPFLQCPLLASCTTITPAKLVMYRAAGNNRTLFDHTTSERPVTIRPAEAARWLVTLLFYDTGGTKSAYRKQRYSEPAPGNLFGCVLVEGSTLKETLLLNLLTYDPDHGVPHGTTHDDRPAWEAEPPQPEPDERSPLGWTDMLTWPSRRVLLRHREGADGPIVDGAVITPGTRLRTGTAKQIDLARAEHMAAYQRRTKAKQGSLTPVKLQGRRGIWRHSQELLLSPGETAPRRRPAAMDQIAMLAEYGSIPEDAVYTLRVMGQRLSDQGGSVRSWHEEAVPAPIALLRAELPEAEAPMGHAIWLADEVGKALYGMEWNYLKTFGDVPDGSISIDLLYWPRLTDPFRRFLLTFAEELRTQQPLASLSAWRDEVTNVAREAARRWAEGAPRRGRYLLLAAEHVGRFEGRLSWLRKRFDSELTRDLPAPPEEAAV